MRRRIKLLFIFSLCALFTSIACFTGCSVDYNEKYEQLLCEHKNEIVIPKKAGTCTEKGLTTGLKCGDCGLILVKQIPTEIEHSIIYLSEVHPTCTESGLGPGYYCEYCDLKKEQKYIYSLGHTYDEQDVCMICGDIPYLSPIDFSVLQVSNAVGGKFIRFYYENFANTKLFLGLANGAPSWGMPYLGISINTYEENNEWSFFVCPFSSLEPSGEIKLNYERGMDENGRYITFLLIEGSYGFTNIYGETLSFVIDSNTTLLSIYDSNGYTYNSMECLLICN